MNRIRLTALSASCLLWMLCMLAACEQENYDKGDGKYSRLVTAFVEAPTNQERQVVYVDTDEGERLALNAPYTAKWLLKADTTYRAVLYYYEEEKEAVRPYMLASLSTATVLPVDSFKKGVKTDPVKFESAWVSKTKKYLNTGIYLKMGTSDNADARHIIGIVRDTIMLQADGKLTLALADTQVELEPDDLLIEQTSAPGFAVQSDRGVTVALNIVLTDELVEEGFMREIISKLQTMRKEAGFENGRDDF